jgi:hypothetical protein
MAGSLVRRGCDCSQDPVPSETNLSGAQKDTASHNLLHMGLQRDRRCQRLRSSEIDEDSTLEVEPSFYVGNNAVLKTRRP